MANWLTRFFKSEEKEPITEATEIFKNRGDDVIDAYAKRVSGEGYEDLYPTNATNLGISSFNLFYKDYIDQETKSNTDRIKSYREMAKMPEIADVLEDAANESVEEDNEGNVIFLNLFDEELSKNENAKKEIYEEFNTLFYNRLDIAETLWDWFYSYMRDGKLFYERIQLKNKSGNGIIRVKKLPAESMGYVVDDETKRIKFFYQRLTNNVKIPKDMDEAKKEKKLVVFYPAQIGYVEYGIYGQGKNDVIGYLENAKIPYNQLRLLEIALVIYRIVRAPERLVFRIDVGNMPRRQAEKYVEQFKNKMSKKQTFNTKTGTLTNETDVLSIMDNFYIPQGENRGSDISSIGGNAGGFSELDDIHYFARKLYRALKYPLSRIEKRQEGRRGDDVLFGQSFGEIARDEIKWSKFLEKQQKKFCRELLNLFLLHMNFTGHRAEYELNKDNINITMNPPSDYREQMRQGVIDQRMNNYQNLANNPEFSKSFLMKKYLEYTDEDLEELSKGFEEDKKYFPQDEGGGGFGF